MSMGQGDGGAGGGQGDGGSGSGGSGSGSGGGTPSPTFTQADLDRVATQQKAEGKRAAEKAIADQFGVSIEEAQRIIASARENEEKEKSEAQRARDAAEAEKKAAADEKAAAAAEKHSIAVERALIRAGIALPEKDTEADALLSRMARLVDAEVGADSETIRKAVEAVKADFPEKFTKPEEGEEGGDGKGGKGGQGSGAPNSDPKGGPPKPKLDNDAMERGRERAKAAAGTAGTGLGGYNLPGS